MSICPECGKKIRGADKVKIKGVWRHHHSPVKKTKKLVSVNMQMKSNRLTTEQIIKRVVQSKF